MNRLYQLAYKSEVAAPNSPLLDLGKEALDLIAAAGAGGRKLQIIGGMSGNEPALHLGSLVRPVVVHHQVLGWSRWGLAIDFLQGLEKLLRAMAALAFPDHLAGGTFQGREQRGSSVPDIVMGLALRYVRPQGQHRSGPIPSLHLTLLIYAQHHGVVGGFKYSPTILRTFSTKKGPEASLNVSVRCGCKANAPKMRETVARDNFVARPGDRVLQW